MVFLDFIKNKLDEVLALEPIEKIGEFGKALGEAPGVLIKETGKVAKTVLQAPAQKKSMAFPVGAGLTPEQTNIAKTVIAKPPSGFEPQPKFKTTFGATVDMPSEKDVAPWRDVGKKQGLSGNELESFAYDQAAITKKAFDVTVGMIGGIEDVIGTKIKTIAASKDAGKIFNLIKPILKGKTDDEIKMAAEELKNISKPAEVKDFLMKSLAKPTTPDILSEAKGKTLEEFVNKNLKNDFNEQYIAGKELKKEFENTGLKPKFNADGTITIYHGTSLENSQKILQSGKFNEMSFFSHAKSKSGFGSEGAKKYGQVMEIKVDPRAINFNQGAGEIEAARGLIRGNDGVWHSPDLKTKSQLTDIWNEAQKGIKPIEETAPVIKPASAKPLLNLDKMNIDDEAKNVITETINAVKPKIEKKVGTVLTNKEVKDFADTSSMIMHRGAGIEQTKNWESQLLKLREQIAAQAESGKVDKDFIDNLVMLKSQATDIGRKLQSFSIGADPKMITAQQELVQAVIDAGAKADDVIKAAQGVDFNDFKQASEFYRKFIEPKTSEWVDLLRYNSMLSSPLTHFVNISSNLLNTITIAPIEKAVAGGIDFLASTITGRERQIFAGESGKFLQGYFSNIKQGFDNFSSVMKGKKAITQLDIKNIPVAVKGIKGKVATALSYPTRLLEAADQFFTTLTEAGESAALKYRQAKGANVKFPELIAKEKAQYRLYRQDLFHESQGTVLDAVDRFTNMIQSLRASKNPLVSNIAKFTVPFIKTLMNIFKQGLEYSPLGFSTLWKSPQKIEQLSKAIIGSSIFAGASSLLFSGRITGAQPIGTAEKQRFLQAGKQAYAIKVGDKWISYQKLPPAIAFPFAMVATINDLIEDKKADDDTISLILTGVAKYGQFLSDQSYARSIGDLLSAVKGGESGIAKLVSNYPQQMIPYRALSGWLARLIDDTQRAPDTKADAIDKQIQYLMMNIPGVSFKVPARTDIEGKPIKQANITNAFSPFRISQENKKFADFLSEYDKFSKATKVITDAKAKTRDNFKPTYSKIISLIDAGKITEAKDIVNKLTDEEYAIYKELKSSDKTKETLQGEIQMFKVVNQVQQLLKEGKESDAKVIVDGLSVEEYKYYKLAKKRLGF